MEIGLHLHLHLPLNRRSRTRHHRHRAFGIEAMDQDGWHPDPFEVHEERLFKNGEPTPLVKDSGVGSYDEPPERHTD
jgi:hypothetical protein